ncbi:HPr family phosphocarrier protein [Actinomadura flavalba]|uniref:HPr family phosphocarrier protein n=1 Tax=Actinomadura flavalba TaxID=1120938 RepID=UPI00038055DA|nr:HPr family phosphocarrier protein [Actinomadura flavalba]
MTERTVKVMSRAGLHARPAALFVQTAARASQDVTVSKRGKDPVNAKSILAVLGLDAHHGEEITLAARGEGADDLLDELEHILSQEEPQRA